MKIRSIGIKSTAVSLAIVFIGIIITAGLATFISGNIIIEESVNKAQNETESNAFEFDVWFTNHKSAVASAAALLSQADSGPDGNLASMLEAALKQNAEYQDFFVGFPDGTAVMGSGYPIEREYGWWRAMERDWYKMAEAKPDEAAVSAPYVDTSTGALCITISKAIKRGGAVVGVVGVDILASVIQDMIDGMEDDAGSYFMLIGAYGDIYAHTDKAFAPGPGNAFYNIGKISDGAYSGLLRKITASNGIYQYKNDKGVPFYYISDSLNAAGWTIVHAVPENAITESISGVIFWVALLTIGLLIAASFISYMTTKKIIAEPLAGLSELMQKSGSTGDLRIEPGLAGIIEKYAAAEDEIGRTIRSYTAFLSHISEVSGNLAGLSNGDLTHSVPKLSDEDVMGAALQKLCGSLNAMLGEVNLSADQVSSASKQIADASQSLAQGATEQAASVQELSGAIADVAEKTIANADKAEKAAQLASAIQKSAEKGAAQMEEMMAAVNDINAASKSISKVIRVIDDIAFQTNILALNAAVEAARAGQYGKGFAVVAEEVRSLAAKSAKAAKETGGMIENSIQKANLGVRIAGDTAESLAKIVSGVTESSKLIGDIAKSSEEQSISIQHINVGVDQVAQVVQQNSATAQQSAASSEEMSSQAATLQHLISQFKFNHAPPENEDKWQPQPQPQLPQPPQPPQKPQRRIMEIPRLDAASYGKY